MPKKSFDAELWIKLGLKTLKNEGLAKFGVEALARKAGVTKGSFYWHFKDRDDYFKQIVDYWLTRQLQIIQHFSQQADDVEPKQQLYNVMHYILNKNTDEDTAMRSWVMHYDYATKAVKKVDKMRLEYLIRLFKEMGYNKDESKLRAQMLYFYQVGEHTILERDREGIRSRLNDLHYKMLVDGVC
ncbi:MAG: TetR/AcrR family transcriptional regulator [Algicola sp.]|nr:TetR/AcrR family transcriptional regulator [Algicola sp.]